MEMAKRAFINSFGNLLKNKQKRYARDFGEQCKDFSKKVLEIQARSGVAMEAFLRVVMVKLLKKVLYKTPVDTGRARAAWTPFLESENVLVTYTGTAEGVLSGIEKGEFEIKKGKNPSILVVNGVNYSIQLEYGSSRKAPEGMVRVSMREIISELERTF